MHFSWLRLVSKSCS